MQFLNSEYQTLFGKVRSVYLVGIGGAGMSGLARILKIQGFEVAGSDRKVTPILEQLQSEGIHVHIGQQAPGFTHADLVIYSTAIAQDHIEMKYAREKGIRICHRAEALAAVFNQAETSIAITGTHGKTTTSAMVSFLLAKLGKSPTSFVGSEMLNFGSNVLSGAANNYFVAEVDESDRTHELFSPNYAIITNLEMDHHESYASMEALGDSFRTFLKRFHFPGLAIHCGDDAFLHQVVKSSGKPSLSYGLQPQNDFSARNIEFRSFGSEFDWYEGDFFLTRIRLSIPGVHNIYNSMGALIVCLQLGFNLEALKEAIFEFRGTRRRLEIKYDCEAVTVVDDYAHHPTEITASLRALQSSGRKVLTVFQPHRYSRVRHLFKEFAGALGEAQEVYLTDIYAAGEQNPDNISIKMIFEEAKKYGIDRITMVKKEDLVPTLLQRRVANEVIAFLGAGDIGEVADEFVSSYRSQNQA
ncbi:MAG TPA: UDP-N-acetylmuramate--L-alanine ligase [Candidatus Omnitrophota bacterium]|nr:UDP-N-acetylmuramate--L-alanine ligase [Candidatus Omnitrophota bacterium]